MTTINRHQAEPRTGVAQREEVRRGFDLAANAAALGVLWIAYTAVRGVTADQLGVAFDNAADVLRFQQLLGLPSELRLQRRFLDQAGLLKAANTYYVAIHFPATVVFLGWAWLRHRERFSRIRNTLVGITIVGLAVHLLYPLAPPRMIHGFVDTAAVFGPNPYDMRISAAANQIAAMPSLHVGWALLIAVGLIAIISSPWRWLALAHPIITAGVVVLTANHYWTDAIVAASLVGIWWAILGRATPKRLASRRQDQPAPERRGAVANSE